jgi:hypothetical protein
MGEAISTGPRAKFNSAPALIRNSFTFRFVLSKSAINKTKHVDENAS